MGWPTYRRPSALKGGWRSGLEEANAALLVKQAIKFLYEKVTFKYIAPETVHRYTPDFVLHNGIIIETKGRFHSADRKKHKLIKAQHPDLDLRFVFSNSRSRLRKGSPTTYAKWAFDHGFQYADKTIPLAWMHEPKNRKSLDALKRLNVKKEKK